MATYPDDATAPVTAFGVVSDVNYNTTGAVRTDLILQRPQHTVERLLRLLTVSCNKLLDTMFQILGKLCLF